MKLAIEVSLYPLDQNYIPYIKNFIERINTYADLYVNTSHTSTVIAGEYDYLMTIVKDEMKQTYSEVGQAIFVCKFLNADHISFDKKS